MYWFNKHPSAIPSLLERGFFVSALFLIVATQSCKPEIKETGAKLKYFDIKEYFKADSSRLRAKDPLIIKTVTHNGKTETEELKVPDWGTELEPFIASDINKPSWRDSYKIQTGTNLLIYTAIDPDVKTRNIRIKKVGNRLIWITIYNHTKNFLYEDKETLTYFPDSLYTIKKWQHVRLMGNDNYVIKAVFN